MGRPGEAGELRRGALTDKTKAIFTESIANRAAIVTDIEAIAAVARRRPGCR